MSVVGPDYDDLKRYNLSEIYYPTPKPAPTPAPAIAVEKNNDVPSDSDMKASSTPAAVLVVVQGEERTEEQTA
ncbi:hypothetical protein EMCG_03109 [[Emmonsia] crescens]|uniref:Uncharacterized protein n=1 Tax=[Emmonsia] crescens TaxID=73230 RepID=A0A0G2J8M6_9EURO|nr:hypothetical protein EMCG_03109 [Emmonsia crescens UAMH 3008]